MRHPGFKLKEVSPNIGLGLVATEFIPKGTILYILDGYDIIVEANKPSYIPEDYINKYAFDLDEARSVVCWDESKYVNHSCSYNACGLHHNTKGCSCNVSIAIKDFYPGDEWLEDYSSYTYNATRAQELICHCNSPDCRKSIGLRVNQSAVIREQQEKNTLLALEYFYQVPQPLLENDLPINFASDCPILSHRDFYTASKAG